MPQLHPPKKTWYVINKYPKSVPDEYLHKSSNLLFTEWLMTLVPRLSLLLYTSIKIDMISQTSWRSSISQVWKPKWSLMLILYTSIVMRLLLLYSGVTAVGSYKRQASVPVLPGGAAVGLEVEQFDRVYGVSLWFCYFQFLLELFIILQKNLYIQSSLWWIKMKWNLVNDNWCLKLKNSVALMLPSTESGVHAISTLFQVNIVNFIL